MITTKKYTIATICRVAHSRCSGLPLSHAVSRGRWLDWSVNHPFGAYFVLQVGNQKPRFRDGYRMALRLCSLVYPPSRLSTYLLAGTSSKNVRSRAECLDELCYLVRETGYRTVGRKGLQKIATLIGTGEKEVRDAAIDVMEALWLQVSPTLHRWVF